MLGSPPEEVFGEGILLTKSGAGTVTALVFLRGAGVGMRVLGAHNFALSSFSMARRPLPGFPPLACMQQNMLLVNFAAVVLLKKKRHLWGCLSYAHKVSHLGFPQHGQPALSWLSTSRLHAATYAFPEGGLELDAIVTCACGNLDAWSCVLWFRHCVAASHAPVVAGTER